MHEQAIRNGIKKHKLLDTWCNTLDAFTDNLINDSLTDQ